MATSEADERCEFCGAVTVQRMVPCPDKRPGCMVAHLRRVCPREREHTAVQVLAALQSERP